MQQTGVVVPGFTDIVGQEKAIQALQQAYHAGRLPHCFLFCGPKGVGKFTTALAWTGLLLCRQPQYDRKATLTSACGKCDTCQALAKGACPDLLVLSRELCQYAEDAEEGSVSTEFRKGVIKEFLVSKVALRPVLSSRRIFIVDEAERLNTEAQNALLKVLEEPPHYCHIVLICARPQVLLSTVRSRSYKIEFSRLPHAVVSAELIRCGLEDKLAFYIAALSNGSLGLAKELAALEQAGVRLAEVNRSVLVGLVDGIQAVKLGLAEAIMGHIENIAMAWARIGVEASAREHRRNASRLMLSMVLLFFQDVLRFAVLDADSISNQVHLDLVTDMARAIGPSGASGAIEAIFRAGSAIDAMANERLVWERLLLQVWGYGRIPTFGGSSG